MKALLSVVLAAWLGSATAGDAELCDSGPGVATPTGRLTTTHCTNKSGHPTRQWLALDGIQFLAAERLTYEGRNKAKTLWVHSGKINLAVACPDRLFLTDLSSTPPTALAFGVRGACNEFHWASWGEKRSVIALKHNVQFVYENGVLKPPRKGEKLWKAIEAPHAGPGLSVEDAIPFVEEISPPPR